MILNTRTVGRRQIIRSGAPWPTMPTDRQRVQIGGLCASAQAAAGTVSDQDRLGAAWSGILGLELGGCEGCAVTGHDERRVQGQQPGAGAVQLFLVLGQGVVGRPLA